MFGEVNEEGWVREHAAQLRENMLIAFWGK